MKLEIGAGNGCRMGFIHTDLNATPGHHLEVICRGEQLPFINECFNEVYMLGVFEHFTQSGANNLISECHRVLCVGGLIEFTFPNLVSVCRIIVEGKLPFRDEQNRNPVEYALGCLYGGQDRPGQIHQWGWTIDSVRMLLKKHGIKIVNFDKNAYEPETHYRVIGVKI